MGTENRHNESMSDESEQAFSKEEDVIQLLRFIFRHGYSDLPSVILPDKSAEERESAIQSLHEQARTNVVDKPTVVDWLQSGLFTDENSNVSLAMLFIEWYEQHSPMSRTQANGECNFREIYHFIYKMMMNQPIPYLSPASAKVLYTLFSEVINEVWPNAQDDLLQYLQQASWLRYSRPGSRRTYSKKKSCLNSKFVRALRRTKT